MLDLSKINYSGLTAKSLKEHDFTDEQLINAGIISRNKQGAYSGQRITKTVIVASSLMIVSIICLIILLLNSAEISVGSLFLPFFLAALAVIIVANYEIGVREKLRLLKFSLDNGFKFQIEDLAVPNGPMMFSVGQVRRVKNRIELGDNIMIAGYLYTVGSGKNRHEIQTEFARVKLSRAVPHIYLNGKHNSIYLNVNDYHARRLELEGDFNDFFTVYTPPDYQVDVLQLLTPDVMLALRELGSEYDFETMRNQLYVYAKTGTMKDPSALEKWLKAVVGVVTQIDKQVSTYSDTRVGNVASGLVSSSGARFRQKRWTLVGLYCLIMGMGALYPFFSKSIEQRKYEAALLIFVIAAIIIIAFTVHRRLSRRK